MVAGARVVAVVWPDVDWTGGAGQVSGLMGRCQRTGLWQSRRGESGDRATVAGVDPSPGCAGRLEIIADFGDQRLAFAEPGIEAA